MRMLPAAGAEFVGRRRELAEGRRLLASSRLLTLTGPPGVGKSRLAVELARHAAAGDVWFVALASLRGVRAPARALAMTAGLAERRTSEELAEALSGGRGLVVLDSCEHLVEPCAALAGALLIGCPELRVMTTSREALGVPGEVVWQVPALGLPDPAGRPGPRRLRSSDAVTFFARSAARRLPGFTVGDAQLATVAGICRRLDANPLAMELAAARVAHLTLEELESRLAGGLQIVQQSLWAAIDWSHDLLTEPDRALFRRLSVFRGGFDLDAAAAVAGSSDVLAGVARLVDKSLVVSQSASGTSRYHLLETLRDYGLCRLRDSDEEAAVRARHAGWFVDLAGRTRALLQSPEATAGLDRFEVEHDNFRAALDWSVDHDPETAARLGAALGEFWTQRGYLSEGRERLDRCLEVAGGGEPPLPLLLAAGNLALRQNDLAGSRRCAERLARQAGDRRALAHAHNLLGRIAYEEDDDGRADEELALAMRLFEELGDQGGVARAHWHLSMPALRRGDLEASARHLATFQAITDAHGNPWGIGHAHLQLAHLGLRRGELEAMASHLQAALPLIGAAGDRWALANLLRLTATLAVERGAGEEGLALLAAADAMDEAIGACPPPRIRRFFAQWEVRALRAVPQAAAGSAQARGRRMGTAEAVEFALDAARAEPGGRAEAGLTRREVEVARLMAAGASDREIGERLGIATRTVEKHAENVRSKLGVESRAAVATVLAT